MANAHAHPAFREVAHDKSPENIPPLLRQNVSASFQEPEHTSDARRVSGSSFLSSDTEPSPPQSTAAGLSPPSEDFEVRTAKTLLMPTRFKPAPPVSNPLGYGGYEHGAPLSDIGEEETTPRSKKTRTRTPSPTASSPTIAPHSAIWVSQKSDRRLSELSNSSGMSTGSDLHWEGFDPRAGLSDRLKRDLAADGDDIISLDGFESKRNSTATNGDDETTTQALSKRAEQILATAKKRLTVREIGNSGHGVLIVFLRTWRAT
jgi:hypothetical protein